MPQKETNHAWQKHQNNKSSVRETPFNLEHVTDYKYILLLYGNSKYFIKYLYFINTVVKSSFSSNSYSRMFFNEAIEEDLVYSIISFILNTSRMCKVLQSSGSNYVSLTDNKVCVSSRSLNTNYPWPRKLYKHQWKRHNKGCLLLIRLLTSSPLVLVVSDSSVCLIPSGYYVKESLHVQRQACLFFAIIWLTLPALCNKLIPHYLLYTCH